MGNANTERKKRQRARKRARQVANANGDAFANWLKDRLDEKLACPETNCDGDCDHCLAAGDDSLYECGDH
jgi:hypothetical protein